MLLAELMLQRTRADLVVPVYVEVLRRYPTAAALADAPAFEVESMLRPLGYKHRSARIRAAAVHCRESVPTTASGLLELPGVGRYASNATLCFAYGRQLAVIDPTVTRVLSRLNLAGSTRTRPREDAQLWAAANQLLPARKAREWNFAVLDHGAVICRPRPRCAECCPIRGLCPSVDAFKRETAAP